MATEGTRARSRPLNTAPAKKVTTEMKTLARTFFTENTEMNARKRAADKARKALFAQMSDAEIESFNMTTQVGDKKVSLDVEIKTPVADVIDVKKLKDLVDEETFMKIISASKKGVTDHAGTVIAAQCSTPVNGTTNVNVKAAK